MMLPLIGIVSEGLVEKWESNHENHFVHSFLTAALVPVRVCQDGWRGVHVPHPHQQHHHHDQLLHGPEGTGKLCKSQEGIFCLLRLYLQVFNVFPNCPYRLRELKVFLCFDPDCPYRFKELLLFYVFPNCPCRLRILKDFLYFLKQPLQVERVKVFCFPRLPLLVERRYFMFFPNCPYRLREFIKMLYVSETAPTGWES